MPEAHFDLSGLPLIDVVIGTRPSGDQPEEGAQPMRERYGDATYTSSRPSSGRAPGIKVRFPASLPTLPIAQIMAWRRCGR